MPESAEEKEARDIATAAGTALILALYAGNVSRRGNVFFIGERRITGREMRRNLARLETVTGRRLTRLTDDLLANRITLNQWRTSFKAIIGGHHLLTGAMASGSLAKARITDRVAKRVAAEQAYADRFADEIEAGRAGTDARIKSRAKSYVMAASTTFFIVEQASQKLFGAGEAMRVLDPTSESCAGCIEYEGEWMPIDEMPELGSLDCGSRCRCYLEYR